MVSPARPPAASMHHSDEMATGDRPGNGQLRALHVSCPFAAISDKTELVHNLRQLMGRNPRPYALLAPSFVGQFGRLASPGAIAADLLAIVFARREVASAPTATPSLAGRLAEGGREGKPGDRRAGFSRDICCLLCHDRAPALPDFAGNIAESFTPIGETGSSIKEKDLTARVVFIVPCIAKKRKLSKRLRPFVETMSSPTKSSRRFSSPRTHRSLLARLIRPTFPSDASALGRAYAVRRRRGRRPRRNREKRFA